MDTIVTFTSRTLDEILASGGSQAWRLSPIAAREASYLVCARNKNSDWSEGPEPHASAFLIGRVSGITAAPENPSRWMVQISEWAPLDIPNLWTFGRNPIHYTTLVDLMIDAAKLPFAPLPEIEDDRPTRPTRAADAVTGASKPLTIAEAKRGLAATFGVGEDAIEITIRG